MVKRGATAGCVLALASSWFAAPTAFACLRAEPEPFAIDAELAADDTEQPAPFRELTGFTHRVEADRCGANGECTSSSCGDAGYLRLQFVPPPEAARGELGYRLVWLSGEPPAAMRVHLDRILPLGPDALTLDVELGWRGVSELDGELALVAVDHAGNESAPSEPLHVSWSGCTDYYDDPFCPDGGAKSQASQPQSPAPASGCSVANSRAAHGLPLWAALTLSLGAVFHARRQRSRISSRTT